MSAYLTYEPWILEQQGIVPQIISPQASLRGWEFAMSHTDEIIDLLLTEYGLTKDLDHLRYEAASIRKLMLPDLIQIGHMNPGRWRHIADTYLSLGMIDSDYSLEGFLYTPQLRIKRIVGIAITIVFVFGVTTLILFLFNKAMSVEIMGLSSNARATS